MKKAILFDLWGTLVQMGEWSPIKQVRNIIGIRMFFSEFVIRMERAMMTQKFESLKDAFENVGKEFNINIPERKMEQLIGMWNKSWMLAKPYEETLELLGKLKEKYSLVLVCNTDAFSAPKVLEKFDLGKCFNTVFFSFEKGILKTDENTIKQVVEELGLNVGDCVFVGDSIHSDMKAAKGAGMDGILIDRKGSREFDPKIKDLNELEKLL